MQLRRQRLEAGKKLALGAMACALTVVALYAASVLPTAKLACCFFSSVFVYALLCEGAYLYALLSFLGSAALAFLITPAAVRWPLAAYVVLLGHYGIFKVFCETNIPDAFIRFALKLAYCNLFTNGAVVVAALVLHMEPLALLPDWPLWVLALMEQGLFIGYDLLYSLGAKIYLERVRIAIIPRR